MVYLIFLQLLCFSPYFSHSHFTVPKEIRFFLFVLLLPLLFPNGTVVICMNKTKKITVQNGSAVTVFLLLVKLCAKWM